jgi:aminoglycoside phosphotransferase (APT) family kinase protein
MALLNRPDPLTTEMVVALATRYGVPATEIRPVPGGVANRAFLLGDDLFLRIPREPAFVHDLRKEAEVIPVARAAGVRTPAIVDFDDSGVLIESPYMVVERVRALDLTQAGSSEKTWPELGRQLAMLHAVRPHPLPNVVADDGGGDPRPTVDELAHAGYLDPGTARWLTGWFDRLAARFPREQPDVLLHGDVAPQNLLVDVSTGEFRALIDWGDAAWGPPGMEFAKLPLADVAATLEGYGALEASAREAGVLEASALWFHLSWGLSGIAKAPRPCERHWTAPPASRLLGVLRFFAGSPPPPWSGLG